ncbi:hypothetical protein M409DRAFT_28605 [Zasmidium cellare ATCC 36951]|uniref:2EXR domain-containing protein n=1 Tax=Zasmidium cellare ATCC 36951 TaxID=1080233 RepID=A0A6A6C1R1_ZASCE|nr:uncharacterized protein M409DRAFT_28605 [Zasmidium cellare ATCC 36951]KAF2160997.1 hypothetical protein M409DRAFT_28605 [Zasmidium cellare ATCC 36951]
MEKYLFNKLPAELRLQIYELALVDQNSPIIITPEERYDQIEPSAVRMRNLPFALINTCKQIRSEAFPIFISQNRFLFAPNNAWRRYEKLPSTNRLWFSYLGEFVEDLKSLDVHLGTYRYEWIEWEDLECDVTWVLKGIRALFRRHPKIKLSIKMAFKFSFSERFFNDLLDRTFEVELYATTLAQAKASVRQQCETYQRRLHGLYRYPYWDREMWETVREIEAYLELLDADPTWSWGVQTEAPLTATVEE